MRKCGAEFSFDLRENSAEIFLRNKNSRHLSYFQQELVFQVVVIENKTF